MTDIQNQTADSKTDRAADIVREAANCAALRFMEAFESHRALCGSPIEELLLAAFYSVSGDGFAEVRMMGKSDNLRIPTTGETIFVYQQARVDKYCVDFLIADQSCPLEFGQGRWMVVECDGHDYHERTKEQAKHDKRRDRFFQSRGFKVLRFTGSEIWADPTACVDEILEQLGADEMWRVVA